MSETSAAEQTVMIRQIGGATPSVFQVGPESFYPNPDGKTITIPLRLLRQLPAGWLVVETP